MKKCSPICVRRNEGEGTGYPLPGTAPCVPFHKAPLSDTTQTGAISAPLPCMSPFTCPCLLESSVSPGFHSLGPPALPPHTVPSTASTARLSLSVQTEPPLTDFRATQNLTGRSRREHTHSLQPAHNNKQQQHCACASGPPWQLRPRPGKPERALRMR